MSQHIHCTISNCHYYRTGNACVANEILVATDQFGENQPDKVDASMAKQLTPENANTCMQTCCKTYVPKNSPNTTADGVNKIF